VAVIEGHAGEVFVAGRVVVVVVVVVEVVAARVVVSLGKGGGGSWSAIRVGHPRERTEWASCP